MKFETEFNIGDEIFVIYENVIQKGKITQIEFPSPSLIYSNFDDKCITCSVWPQSFGSLPESHSWACKQSIKKKVCEIGRDMDDLCKKIQENAKHSGLIKQQL